MSGNNSVVECNLAKVDVASSNLVSRSTISAAWPSGKATACKAVILQFESGSRLQYAKKPLTHRVNGFFAYWAWRSHASLAPQSFRRPGRSPEPASRITEGLSPRFPRNPSGDPAEPGIRLPSYRRSPLLDLPATLQAPQRSPEPASRGYRKSHFLDS